MKNRIPAGLLVALVAVALAGCSSLMEGKKVEYKSAGKVLTDTPAKNIALTLGAKFPDQALRMGWRVQGFDAITTASATTSASGYAVHDAFLSWQPQEGALAGIERQRLLAHRLAAGVRHMDVEDEVARGRQDEVVKLDGQPKADHESFREGAPGSSKNGAHAGSAVSGAAPSGAMACGSASTGAGSVQPSMRSNTAIDSTCAVCGNMLTTPAAAQR